MKMGSASGDLSASGVVQTEKMISWVGCSRSWVRRMPRTASCRIFGSIRRGSSSLEIIFKSRPVRRLTNCFRNCRRPLLRWVAALQGHIPKVRDATQAYIQARIDGPDRPRTWVRLPRQWRPAAWFDASGKPLYDDTVVPLVRALCGHPESGALWDAHLGAISTRMEVHPGLRLHKMTGAVMAVYVDDLLLAAGKNDEARL